jgi:hypothetical protein
MRRNTTQVFGGFMTNHSKPHLLDLITEMDELKVVASLFRGVTDEIGYKTTAETAKAIGINDRGTLRVKWHRLTKVEKVFVLDGTTMLGYSVRCWYNIDRTIGRITMVEKS